jgi:NADH-dependent fumarate reductase subunit E
VDDLGYPPEKLMMMIDLDRCIGCGACEVSCKLEHMLPPGARFLRVIEIGLPGDGERLFTLHIPVLCQHCAEPHCLEVCPSGAITKNDEGVVSISEELCVGCGLCIEGCPFGIPTLHPDRQEAVKCNFCLQRIEKGLWPACATKCSMKTIYFGSWDFIKRIMGEKRILGLGDILLGKDLPWVR